MLCDTTGLTLRLSLRSESVTTDQSSPSAGGATARCGRCCPPFLVGRCRGHDCREATVRERPLSEGGNPAVRRRNPEGFFRGSALAALLSFHLIGKRGWVSVERSVQIRSHSVQQFAQYGWSRKWTNLLRWITDESSLGGPFGYVPYRNLERMRVGVLTLDYDLSGVLCAR
ncbi:hypothetical protein TNIN_202231 [Trichonephila inaurata madagascariensis]|uniref:Uncharacterized protein n=1 Tax=Trichonephila inaurata madagascariensis TaxID=2747483 RepID=A0A8X6XHB0_9ARAC|nr:hypothetical protein TNIN_202231 [Trichonephila inaurata madagascariensis]